ncbi:hypothetical protein FNV43_RR01509 [Rhamnella rubrinervis]|uniref:Uncharacterized protein n=1 Tax=Rhamnella rubrinervis TaxID=2594499 RepID=A0A8K0HSD6_9ROSA|nr:hypothetical protein FNV43_RR01509 [Rhamnella rubrinervis]
MSTCPGDKTSWPELVGTQGDVAVGVIKTENPNLNVFTLPVGSFVTGDHDCNRVRVYVNANDFVAKVPKLG